MAEMMATNFSLDSYRQQFPALANKAYFNYGGQGPLPEVALTAIVQSFQQVQQLGPFAGRAYTWVVEETEQTRQAIATELNASPETITLTEDVTVGCNIALWGIEWQAGDHLLLTDCEHPGIIAAIQEVQRRFGVEVSTCPLQQTLNSGDPVETIVHHLRPRTRMVVLSHILWNTGQVLPLQEITTACHHYRSDKPVWVLVDAAQSVGVLPLNLTELAADFYAFTGHKWWCGPEGLGGLYVRPEARAELHPTFIGWRNITTASNGKPTGWKPDGRKYEIATSAYPLYAGLREAIAVHDQWGTVEQRYQRIQELSGYLWQQLVQLNGISCLKTTPPEAGLVSFELQNRLHKRLVDALESQDIMVRTILDPDCVRVCVHYFTQESELDWLVDRIKNFIQS